MQIRVFIKAALVAMFFGAFQFTAIAQTGKSTATKSLVSPSTNVKKAENLIDDWRSAAPVDVLPEIEQLLKKALVENPNDYFAYRQLSRLMVNKSFVVSSKEEKTKMLFLAKEALEKSMQINSEYADAYVFGGYLYKAIGDVEKAKNSLSTAAQLGSKDVWFYWNMAEIDFEARKYAEALINYKLALIATGRSTRSDLASLRGIQNSYWYLGDKDKYVESLRLVIDLEPNEGWHYGNYAMAILCNNDKYDESIDFFKKALSLKKYGYARRGLAGALYRKSVSNGVSAEQKTKLRIEAKELYEGEPIEILTQICGANSNKIVKAYTSDAAK